MSTAHEATAAQPWPHPSYPHSPYPQPHQPQVGSPLPPQPLPALPPIPVAPPDAGPVRFHGLVRTLPGHRLGRSIGELALAGGVFTVIQLVFGAIGAALYIAYMDVRYGDDGFVDAYDSFQSPDFLLMPVPMFFTLATIALGIPCAFLAVRAIGRRRIGSVLSVAGRFRWANAFRAGAIALTAYALATIIGGLFTDDLEFRFTENSMSVIAVAVLTVPFQAGAEELLFRGVFAQAVGSKLRHPAWAILIPTPFFVILHGYGLYGLASIAVFGICAGILAWATGGLEVPIAFHAANNIVVFSVSGLLSSSSGAEDESFGSMLVNVATLLVVTGLLLADRGLRREPFGWARAVPPKQPAPMFAGMYPSGYTSGYTSHVGPLPAYPVHQAPLPRFDPNSPQRPDVRPLAYPPNAAPHGFAADSGAPGTRPDWQRFSPPQQPAPPQHPAPRKQPAPPQQPPSPWQRPEAHGTGGDAPGLGG